MYNWDEWQLSDLQLLETELSNWGKDSHFLKHRILWSSVKHKAQWPHKPSAPLRSIRKEKDTKAFHKYAAEPFKQQSNNHQTLLFPYLDFQDASEGHAEVSIVVFTKDPLEGLLEQRGVERVSHHNVTPDNAAQQSVSIVNST